jgi:O-succinylbenzoic acid--CoA ligase
VTATLYYKNRSFRFDEIRSMDVAADHSSQLACALHLMQRWLNGASTFTFQTSGSTGTPGNFHFQRGQLEASARATISFLHLGHETIFVCLHTRYVAGAMMLVRALLLDADIFLADPSSDPMQVLDEHHTCSFSSFVPMQLHGTVQNPGSLKKLQRFRNILVGGAAVSTALEAAMPTGTACWHTYGMTETLSHIALRRMGHAGNFRPLPGISIRLNENGCLAVKGAVTLDKWVHTKDLAAISDDGSFAILGRIDFVINSGGYKIHPENVEPVIESVFRKNGIGANFFITGIADEKLHQRCTLVVEGNAAQPDLLSLIRREAADRLHAFEVPKEVIFVPRFYYTQTGKTDRLQTLRSLADQ